MGEIYSSHGGTFSEGIPNIKIKESFDILDKCPNCESTNCIGNKCLDCGFGYDGGLLEEKYNLVSEEIKDKVEKNIEKYSICECGNKMGLDSIMCKDCYNKYKLLGEI